jgi:amino-acid N-acetyltransferase
METETLTNVIVRPARPDDLGALAEFIKPFVAEGKLLPRTLSELEDFLPSFFVAELDGRLIGCAALEVYSWKLAEVRSLAVAPEARGMGIGRLLVNVCVSRAREQRILEVMAITSSEDFFKSCGFDFTLPGEKKALFIQTRDEI